MTGFTSFVLFAEMRTGSNLLEANLNALTGVCCHGEAFNPSFVAYPNRDSLLGISKEARDTDPLPLLAAIRQAEGLNGFRYFHSHDPRILDTILSDRTCAKILLSRNPLDSFVSLQIARETGQWKLTQARRRRSAQVHFDGAAFAEYVATQQAFRDRIQHQLLSSGQTAFYLDYAQLRDLDILNGLATWLGVEARLDHLDDSLKPQNPGPVLDKVTNPQQMQDDIAALDPFGLWHLPVFEPTRGPSVPSYVAGAHAPLLFLPLPGGPTEGITNWLADLDQVAPAELGTGFNQKRLRQWKRTHPGHRSFTVLRHPVARAHEAFCTRILSTGPGSLHKIRDTLRRKHKLPLPAKEPGPGYTRATHKRAFLGFLDFLGTSLAGQSGLRLDPAWASQSQILSGFCDFAPPDEILREEDLPRALPRLAAYCNRPTPNHVPDLPDHPHALSAIYDEAIEAKAADIYQRDYLMFGFGPWQPSTP